MEIHADNSNEQINAENASNDDENDEEYGNPGIIVHDWPSVVFGPVDSRVHVIGPSLQRRKHEQRNHCV
jgi:hypothetical protein